MTTKQKATNKKKKSKKQTQMSLVTSPRRKLGRGRSRSRSRSRSRLVRAIIGEGSFGCIVTPALSCDNQNTAAELSRLVAKVMTKEEADKELEEAARLSRIDILVTPPDTAGTSRARYKFGVYALRSCPLTRATEELDSWKAAIIEHETAHPGLSKCGNADRTVVLHIEAAVADCSRMGQGTTAAYARAWLPALRNLAMGLQNMHARGFVHFDAKPENFLFFGSKAAPSTAKLTDFGQTRHVSDKEFQNASAFNMPWSNYPPACSIAFNAAQDIASAAAMEASRPKPLPLAQAQASKSQQTRNAIRVLNASCSYWGATGVPLPPLPPLPPFQRGVAARTRIPPPVVFPALRAPAVPRMVSPALDLLQKQGALKGQQYTAHMPEHGKAANGKGNGKANGKAKAKPMAAPLHANEGVPWIPPFADRFAYTAEGIAAHGQTAAERLSLLELGAAADWYGFALVLQPLHRVRFIAALVKEFFDKAAAMQLSDFRAIVLIDSMIAAVALE
jgi:hypothetical protein